MNFKKPRGLNKIVLFRSYYLSKNWPVSVDHKDPWPQWLEKIFAHESKQKTYPNKPT